MFNIKPSIVLEDSKGNKYFFYYKDSSIYYKEVLRTGENKDTTLISQVSSDFAAAIDAEDTIYVTCNSRYKGVLLFSHTNYGWNFEPVVTVQNSSSIYLMDLVVMNGSVHIFFSKKMPIANLYNVYHIHRNIYEKVSYADYPWRKNSLSEIYSQNIENSYSLLPVKGGNIHYASVWHDGTYHFINYYCYDEANKSWFQKSLNISFKNPVAIKLLYQNKKVNLLCYSSDYGANNIRHFVSKASNISEIDFKELASTNLETNGVVPLFYTDEKSIQLAWVKDRIYHQYTFDDTSAKWKKSVDLPVSAETDLLMLKTVKNSGYAAITKDFSLLDKDYNISRPAEQATRQMTGDKPKERHQNIAATGTSDYIKQLLDEIKDLTVNMQYLNHRIDGLEGKSNIQVTESQEKKNENTARSKPAVNDIYDLPPLKKSNFKEKFMKNKKVPLYENLLQKQEQITTYVGKPSSVSASVEAPEDMGINTWKADDDNQAFVDSSPAAPVESADAVSEAEKTLPE